MFRRTVVSALVIAWALALASLSLAQHGRGRAEAAHPPHRVVVGEVFVGGYFYDPFWGPYPWWPRWHYPFSYYPRFDYRAFVRMKVVPDTAAVYVDGFYAGVVDDFDGVFDGLPLPPGGHNIVFYLEGYRTARHNLYLPGGTSFTVRETLERLPPDMTSDPPTEMPPVPTPPAGSYRAPATPRPPVTALPGIVTPALEHFGTLDLRVQPASATVRIDGEEWVSSEFGHFVIELPAGTHRLEVTELGHQRVIRDLIIREGATIQFTVSLVPATR
jgi:hypothetical protein